MRTEESLIFIRSIFLRNKEQLILKVEACLFIFLLLALLLPINIGKDYPVLIYLLFYDF